MPDLLDDDRTRRPDAQEALLLHQGKTLSRTRLIMHVYDDAFESDSNVIDAHVANLRPKLREAVGLGVVETVRGVGFRVARRDG